MGLRAHLVDGAETVLLAHTAKKGTDGDPETLIDHSDLVLHFFEKLCHRNGLSAAIERSIEQLAVKDEPLSMFTQQMIGKWFKQAIYLHDLGKVNPVFQTKKMRSPYVEKLVTSGDSTHALLSALLYLHIYLPELDKAVFSLDGGKDRSVRKFMKHVLYVFAYVISRHHTYMANIEEMDGQDTQFEKRLQSLQKQLNKYPDYLNYYRHKEIFLNKVDDSVSGTEIFEKISKGMRQRFPDLHTPFPFYVLTKLLYSTMVACDFYATHQFDTGIEPKFQYFSEDHELRPVLDAFYNTGIYQSVQSYRENKDSTKMDPINKLRSALFVETETQLLLNLQQHLFYLEAPTGSGKTFMSLNLALKLLDNGLGLNKLIYVFPFNALIEQTKQTLDSVFSSDLQDKYRMTVVNSITPIVTEQEIAAGEAQANGRGEQEPDIPADYKTELLQRQMLQYPVTLTSHVNFFNYLFGVGRESNLAFTHLCNSVVILDEIQSYRNEIWKEIIHFLRSFAQMLNMKIIIMSATLPQLDLLMEGEPVETCSLVVNRDLYFQNPLFRDRVHPHFDLLQFPEIDEDTLLEAVLGVLSERRGRGKPTRLFIEFITKKTARSFYDRLRSVELSFPLFELTGDDNNLLRKQVLSQLGKDKHGKFILLDAIVVATQVIEAGVDIDMDIGFKDISILDSEEQFLGRINRSCLREDCHAYFFNMFKTTKIYQKDWRTEYDLQTETYQKMLLDKDFSGFYQLCMGRLNEERQKANQKNWLVFISDVQQLQFKKVEEQMKLIPEQQNTLFIDHKLSFVSKLGVKEELDGTQVWEQFKYLLADKELSYPERIVKLSQTKEKMSYFTYSHGVQGKDTPGIYDEKIGSLYFVPNGERFMDPDEITGMKKFNRQAYMALEGSLLL